MTLKAVAGNPALNAAGVVKIILALAFTALLVLPPFQASAGLKAVATPLTGPNGTLPISSGGAPCAAIEQYGASPSASAATNKTAIDNALATAPGCYSLTTPGTYSDNFNHTINSDTTFYVGPGVIIRQANGNEKHFMSNANYQAASVTLGSNITEAALAGSNRLSLATAAWPSTPTVAVGQYMEIRGDTTGFYNGVWKVNSVSGNNVTFIVPGQRSNTSAGTILASPADANITLRIEGFIDYNEPNNTTSSSGLESMTFIFNRVGNLLANPLRVINGNKYGVLGSNIFSSVFKNVYAISGSDLIHLSGYFDKVSIQTVRGATGDDTVAWTAQDSPAGYIPTDGTGSGYNLFVDDVAMENTDSHLVALFASTGNGSLYNARLSRLTESTNNGAGVLLEFGSFYNVVVDKLDGYGAVGIPGAPIAVTNTTIDNLTICHLTPAWQGAAINTPIALAGTSGTPTTITNLKLCDSSINMVSSGSQDGVIGVSDYVTVTNLFLINDDFTTTSTDTMSPDLVYVTTNGTINNIVLSNSSLSGYITGIAGTGLATPNFIINNVLNNARSLGLPATNINYYINGLTQLNSNSPFHLFTGGTYNFQASNVRNPGAATLLTYSGGTLNILPGGDCSMQYPGSNVTPQAGAEWFNTSAGYGSGVGCYMHATLLAN